MRASRGCACVSVCPCPCSVLCRLGVEKKKMCKRYGLCRQRIRSRGSGHRRGCPGVEQLYGPRFAQAQAIDGKLLTLRVLSPLRTQIGCACSMWDG